MDNGPPARAGRKKEEDGRRMRMRSGEERVMLMTTGGLDVLRLKTMMVEVNDAGMLMAVEAEIDGGYLMMVEGEIGVWMMRRMSGGGMKS